MTRFITKYADHIKGVLSGFDRLVFHGALRPLAYVQGFQMYLNVIGVRLTDFGEHAAAVTEEVKEASLAEARRVEAPIIYLPSSQTSKEQTARGIAAQRQVQTGLVCVLKTVEMCHSYQVVGNRNTQRLELVHAPRKCLHLYHYWMHPVFGFMSARLQTWYPFNVQVCLNGREWLARQMDAAAMPYVRHDNCFAAVGDFARAQGFLQEQLQSNWPLLLGGIGRQLNPIHERIFERFHVDYYWSTAQSEWATDIVFRDNQFLAGLYPKLVQHAMTTLDSPDVMRFLGRALTPAGGIHPAFQGQVTTDLKRRAEGVRVKHAVNHNSVKAYDKLYAPEGADLRVETTINTAEEFKVYRPKEGGKEDDLAWRELRKGTADLARRAEVSQRANERYLDALASVDDSTTLAEATRRIVERTTWKGKSMRALNPFAAADLQLLQAVSHGEFAINGMRNRDLRQILFGSEPGAAAENRKQSACVTRKIRLLRAHGILQKVNQTNRYQLTASGRRFVTAILAARDTKINRLAPEPLANAA